MKTKFIVALIVIIAGYLLYRFNLLLPVFFWLYVSGIIYVLISVIITYNQQSKLGISSYAENLRNYFNHSRLFLSKAQRKKMKTWGLFRHYFIFFIVIIRNCLVWPGAMIFNVWHKGIRRGFKNMQLTKTLALQALYPGYNAQAIFVFLTSLILFFNAPVLKNSTYFLLFVIFLSIATLLSILVNTLAATSILQEYKRSFVNIRSNVLFNFLMLIINAHLLIFLLINHYYPGVNYIELFNAIKNELLGMNAFNTLISGDTAKIKETAFYWYMICTIGIILKISVLNQVIKAWNLKKDIDDNAFILKFLLQADEYGNAYKQALSIKNEDNRKDILYLKMLAYLANNKTEELHAEIKRVNQLSKNSIDIEYMNLIVTAWQYNLKVGLIVAAFELWIKDLKDEGYFVNMVELCFSESPLHLKELSEILHRNDLADYLPLTNLILNILLGKGGDINILNKLMRNDNITMETIAALQYHAIFCLIDKYESGVYESFLMLQKMFYKYPTFNYAEKTIYYIALSKIIIIYQQSEYMQDHILTELLAYKEEVEKSNQENGISVGFDEGIITDLWTSLAKEV